MLKKVKKFLLFVRKIFKIVKRYFTSALSYFILFLCGCLFVLAVGTNISHKAPVLAYWADELHFPYKFSLTGVVEVYKDEELVSAPVNLHIGGYSTETDSSDVYQLIFTSSDIDNIPIVISVLMNDEQYTFIDYVSFEGVYEIQKKIVCYVGD